MTVRVAIGLFMATQIALLLWSFWRLKPSPRVVAIIDEWKPMPQLIPERDFEALLRYLKQEVYLDQVAERMRLLPINAGQTAAMLEIMALRLENLDALLFTRVLPPG
jgi:hypothetical protein